MKKLFFLSALLLCCIVSDAQLNTYSSNDTNLDGDVSVADISKVASALLSGSSNDESQVVDVKELNQLLKSIDARLAAIEAKLNTCRCGSDTVGKDTVIEAPSIHQYVDLGLPSGTLWATCNVGANSPEDYGLYFAWGETKPKSVYSLLNYKWFDGNEGSSTNLTRYQTHGFDDEDNIYVLLPEDDAATVNWGPEWQVPTDLQMSELLHCEGVSVNWTTQNGVNGCRIIGPNGNSIFLPAAGYQTDYLMDKGDIGYYWSASAKDGGNCTYYIKFLLSFDSFYHDERDMIGGDILLNYSVRYPGMSVRPVRRNK